MTIKEILNATAHKPWALPTEKWKYYQEWNNAIFLHWQVDYEELKKFIPEDLEIDLYDGKPWVSLVAFTMEKVRPRYFPSFPPISNFHEINIRTYVKREGKPGVYFLSIEGGTQISCLVAKTMSELPYRYSKMKRTGNAFLSENRQYGDSLEITYETGQEMQEKTGLDKWLTERYALFQDTDTSINEFEIHHIEWPTNDLQIKECKVNYPRFRKLFSRQPDKTHYSPGVQVVTWDKKKKQKQES
jgi:uncharacterized protein